MAFLALIVQTIMITLKQMRQDMAGIGHDKDVSDERFKAVYGVYDMAVKYEEALFLLIAVFGLPSLDLDALMADPTPLLAVLPVLGLTYNWKKFEVSTLIKNVKSKSLRVMLKLRFIKVYLIVVNKVGGTFLYRRINGVFDATKQWYYCCDTKWCFICDSMFLLFQYLH